VAVTKRLQLLHELMPQAAAIAYLMNPNNLNGDIELRAAQTAAHSLGKEMPVLRATNERELDTAFATLAQQKTGALLVASDPFFYWQRNQLISLAARDRIAAMYYLPGFTRAGGLMSYGNSLTDMYRLVVSMLAGFSRARSLPICRSSSPLNSSW